LSFSIIIPTYNRADKLIETLNSLIRTSLINFELVLVIDGSEDHTSEKINSVKNSFQNIKIITQENKGRSSARNKGAKESEGDLLIFYDDDIILTEESVSRHLEFHSNHENSICGGNIIEEFSIIKTDFGLFKYGLTIKWIDKYINGYNLLQRDNLFLTAANFSIPRNLFFSLGGFNESLPDVEDFELAARAFIKGLNVYFDKDNMAYNNDSITCKKYIERNRQYNHAKSIINPQIIKYFLTGNRGRSFLKYLKKFYLSLFSNRWMIRMIDNEKFYWMPKFIRYKVYDWVVTGLGSYFPERKI
jgi:glycosyltransferase involved in cell wall biosynthesis